MINRLVSVIHWIGFVCLLIIGFYIFVLFADQGRHVEYVIRELWRLLVFDAYDENLSMILWAAVSHLPIKFIITGDKNLFPWSRGSSND